MVQRSVAWQDAQSVPNNSKCRSSLEWQEAQFNRFSVDEIFLWGTVDLFAHASSSFRIAMFSVLDLSDFKAFIPILTNAS